LEEEENIPNSIAHTIFLIDRDIYASINMLNLFKIRSRADEDEGLWLSKCFNEINVQGYN